MWLALPIHTILPPPTWSQGSCCRRLRLTLSCVQHEHLWMRPPVLAVAAAAARRAAAGVSHRGGGSSIVGARLARLLQGRGTVSLRCLRLLHVPLGNGKGGLALPESLDHLADMVQQVAMECRATPPPPPSTRHSAVVTRFAYRPASFVSCQLSVASWQLPVGSCLAG